MDDPHDLYRFVRAQATTYDTALKELSAGRKRSHWMWFVFPQLAGLGRSETARFYGIRSLDEARAYLLHPILGERLRACVAALQRLAEPDAEAVFGTTDAMKLRSSLTLFEAVDPDFGDAIERWFGGQRDATTLRMLGRG